MQFAGMLLNHSLLEFVFSFTAIPRWIRGGEDLSFFFYKLSEMIITADSSDFICVLQSRKNEAFRIGETLVNATCLLETALINIFNQQCIKRGLYKRPREIYDTAPQLPSYLNSLSELFGSVKSSDQSYFFSSNWLPHHKAEQSHWKLAFELAKRLNIHSTDLDGVAIKLPA